MKPQTREWIEKAEGDFVSALREIRARKKPNYDAACFHAQQCAEKYMKAWLQEHDTAFDKTHDLVRLLGLMPAAVGLQALRPGLAQLSAAAVEFRYPGNAATRDDAKQAVAICRALRSVIRDLLAVSADDGELEI